MTGNNTACARPTSSPSACPLRSSRGSRSEWRGGSPSSGPAPRAASCAWPSTGGGHSVAQRAQDDSPEIRFAEELQRDVSMRQQVYTTLAQAMEEARIEEVRETQSSPWWSRPSRRRLPAGGSSR